MKYMLRAKRWSALDFIYPRRWGTTEQCVFFNSEKDILDFFKLLLEEDIVQKTRDMDKHDLEFETVMYLSSNKFSFREIIRNRFSKLLDIIKSLSPPPADMWRFYYATYRLKCNPKNYRLYTIVEHEARGLKFEKIQYFSWYKFYNKCLESGMKEDFAFISAD